MEIAGLQAARAAIFPDQVRAIVEELRGAGAVADLEQPSQRIIAQGGGIRALARFDQHVGGVIGEVGIAVVDQVAIGIVGEAVAPHRIILVEPVGGVVAIGIHRIGKGIEIVVADLRDHLARGVVGEAPLHVVRARPGDRKGREPARRIVAEAAPGRRAVARIAGQPAERVEGETGELGGALISALSP